MTPAGSAVVAAAEILGCMTATTIVDPDVYYYSTSISAEMDMRTTQPCFSTPAAILTDALLHQLFRYRYRMVHNIDAGYVEAKTPGIQAAFMKTYRQMAFASTASSSLPIGLLDNAAAFSPVQAMIDLDTNRAIYKLGQGVEVNDETLCEDLIDELEFCTTRTYLESEHTFKHFRSIGWDAKYFDRAYRRSEDSKAELNDDKLLKRADRDWRELLEAQADTERDPSFVKQVDEIVAAAKKELLD